MISREEARLGTIMSNFFVGLILVNFGIQIFVLGPDQVGYDSTWGPVLSICLLYTSPSPRDGRISRMPSSA